MSYEIESITNSNVPMPAQVTPMMREEITYDPYRARVPRGTGQNSIGQIDSGETAAAVESKQTEETVRLSPQVAALARKEQRFRAQQQELEKERAAIAAEKSEIAQLKAMKAKLAAKDYSGLDGLVDYNEYSQYQINKANGTDPAQEAIKRLSEEVSTLKRSQDENISKQFEAAVSERRIAVRDLIEKNPEFSRIKKANAEEAVVQHILDTWEHDVDKDGKPVELSIAQAAKEVNDILLEKAKQWAALLEEKEAAQLEDLKKTLPPLKQSLKTLTNQVTSGDLKRPLKSLHLMGESERYAEARRRAEEKLQKGQ